MSEPPHPPPASGARGVLRSAFAMLALTTAQRGAGLLTIMGLARLLDPKGVGAYTFTINASQSFQAMTRLGLDTALHIGLASAATMPAARKERMIGEAFGLTLAICVVTSVAMAVLSPWVASELFKAPELQVFVLFSAVYIIGVILAAFCYAAFAGLNAFAPYAQISGFGAIGTLITALTGGFLAGPLGAATGLVLAQSLMAVALLWALAQRCTAIGVRLRPFAPGAETKHLLTLGMPFYLGFLLLGPAEFFAWGMVSQFNGTDGLGQLRIAQALISVAQALPAALSGPFITHLAERESAGAGQSTLAAQLRIVWSGALLVGIGLVAVFPFLIHLVFGAGYELAESQGVLAVCAFLGTVVVTTLQGALLAQRRTALLFVVGAVQAAVIIAAGLWLTPLLGLAGYFLAQTLTFAVGAALCWAAVCAGGKRAPLFPGWMIALLAASALAFGVTLYAGLGAPSVPVRLGGCTLALLAVALLCWFGVFTPPERARAITAARSFAATAAARWRPKAKDRLPR